MIPARSEEDILAGVIRVRVGAVEKAVPTLKLGPAREWKATVGSVLGTSLDEFDINNTADVARIATSVGDSILDVVLGYDVTGALGGREWLEQNADDAELYVALRQFLDVSFPFVSDLNGVLGQLRQLLAIGAQVNAGVATEPPTPVQRGGRSTSSRSPSGASRPTQLKAG